MLAMLAKPRGFCAGVERAIRTVELAIERYGPPVYVLREIVHNVHVVRRLGERGAVFVGDLEDVPNGAVTILAAHGCPPAVYAQAEQRHLRLIDATCPLVRKVHLEVARYAARGYRVLLIGHPGHDEVVGTMGQAPDRTVLISDVGDASRLTLDADEPAVVLTQTTLSQDDARELIETLLKRFPQLERPAGGDICYATQNRQNAVKSITDQIDLLLVVGSWNSSNSQRLTEVARSRGVESYLIDDARQIRPEWLARAQRVGVTSGASAPEDIVQGVLARLRELGVEQIEESEAPDEGVTFKLPSLDT